MALHGCSIGWRCNIMETYLIEVIMYKYIIALTLVSSFAYADNLRVCESWDTFCKSPKQIVATKCRLGVPVKWEQCEALNIPSHYMIRGGGSLVEGLPTSKGIKL